MPTLFVGTIDRFLADALLAGARRRWPLLRLIPRPWLQRLLMPTARHLRCSLGGAAMFISLSAIATIAALGLSN